MKVMLSLQSRFEPRGHYFFKERSCCFIPEYYQTAVCQVVAAFDLIPDS